MSLDVNTFIQQVCGIRLQFYGIVVCPSVYKVFQAFLELWLK